MKLLPDLDIDVQIGRMQVRTGDALLMAARAYWFEGPCGSRYDAVLTIATVLALHFRLELHDVLNAMARWCERHRIRPASRRDTEREVRAHYRRWHRGWERPVAPRTAWVEPNDGDHDLAAVLSTNDRARDAVARLAAHCRHNGPDVIMAVSFLSALAPGSITVSGVRRRLGQYVRDLLEGAGILALVKAHSAARTSLSGVGSGRVYRYHAERAAEIAAHGRSSVGEDDTKDLHPSVAHAVRAIRAHLAGHPPGARVDLRASTLDALCGGNTVTVDGKRVRAAQLARAWLVERDEVVQRGCRYFVPSPCLRDSEG